MSKGMSYAFSGTKGYIVSVAASLPKTGDKIGSTGVERNLSPSAGCQWFTYL